MTPIISTDNKRNPHVNENEQQLASTYSDSATSFLYNNDNNDSHQYIDALDDLDLPYGLIDLLINNNYTLPSLLNTDPSELSNILFIDQEVAAIICAAVKKMKKN